MAVELLLRRKDSRAGSHLGVSLKDRNKWAAYRRVDSPDLTEADILDDEKYSGREADMACRFGEKTWKPGAPLKPRGIASVELHHDRQADPGTQGRTRLPSRRSGVA
ncbi:hypothetical protein [Streptomyces virginiae]|uniref:hypothetical protein n=1 Tax=Streptomyces virginiae TaxID=1961 RepID=UPI0036FBD6C7